MNYLSEVAKKYPASGIRRMHDLASEYEDIINLTIGEPDFDTPQNIIEAAKNALDQGYTHYSSNAGIQELREAIANYYKKYTNEYTSKNIIITVGAMEAIYLSLVTTINPGDEVLIPNPCFPNYEGQIMMVGAKPVPVPLFEKNNFKIRAEDIEKVITDKSKAILLNYPSNPLGSVLGKDDINEIAEVVKKYDLIVFSDEVYDKIIYDDDNYCSILENSDIRDKVIVINSLSKSYAMTGWRIGYLVGNEKITSHMTKLQEGIVSCVPTFIQKAAVQAITNSEDSTKEMVSHYKRRRDILIDGLNSIPGISCLKSSGSFYAFTNIKSFKKPSMQFAKELMKEAKVLAVPGSAFGTNGEGYLRFVFATSEESLNEAVKRINQYIRKNY
ncbi:MAG: pyridoxal phosphate-dependent aminotransferase [Tissierellia bacterium]|nr:pyridoxal phosphate-dependent aminotransferase [Tissierellia bacterium]